MLVLVVLSALPAFGNPKADSTLKAALAAKPYPAKLRLLYDGAVTFRLDTRAERCFANAFWAEYKKQPVDSNAAKGLYLMADVELSEGAYEAGMQHAVSALKLARAGNLYTLQANILSAMSGIYLRTNNPEESLNTMAEAVAIARSRKNYHQLANFLEFLGIRYAVKGNTEKALSTLDSASSVAKAHRYNDLLYEILITRATVYSINGQTEKSLTSVLQALPLAKTVSTGKYVQVNLLAGQTYFKLKNFKLAQRYLDKAASMLDEGDDPELKASIYNQIFHVSLANGQIEKAQAARKTYEALRDSLFDIDKTNAIQELKTKYETEAKDKQLDEQSAQLQLDRKINLFLLVTVALVIAIGLIIYINQRRTRKLNRQITRQSQELERLNSVKDRLFSTISHDMREPVNSLISFTMLLKDGAIPPEQLSVYTNQLQKSLNYTSGLMSNLLEFSRSQIQGFKPNMQQIDLADVMIDAVYLFEPLAQQKQIAIVNTIQTGSHVTADMNMVALIARNLVNNAVKFTKPGGTVTIGFTQPEGLQPCFLVTDDGVGIDAESVLAFNTATDTNIQPLHSTTGTAKEKGTGLGLLLCKNLASSMNGTISLQSQPGQGTTFSVCLPGLP